MSQIIGLLTSFYIVVCLADTLSNMKNVGG